MLNRQGRPTTPNQQAESDAAGTITGNRGLLMEEALIFEQGEAGRTGVDLPDAPKVQDRLGGLKRQGRIGLPGLSEPQVIRHFVRLSQKNYSIDAGLYPLGSCTMKRSEEHTSELQSLMRISYAVFCLKKKK